MVMSQLQSWGLLDGYLRVGLVWVLGLLLLSALGLVHGPALGLGFPLELGFVA